ncbi:mediator of RNA polymerase II transcription subunit 20 isoform X1 [Brachyistius frenatus]|uniref:mediator of RNA polymerase II transcription subunit 20 isoform X1 n=1 Tax=Brachyistius frenatus TaxID=100188 RepID=UPI0037E885A8
MGVTCVCQVPVAEGKSVQQTVDILHRKLEQLGAVKQGSFCVDCETYHATGNVSGQPSKLLYVMHNSETPLSCQALFEGGPCLIADANFDVLMVKLKSHFQNAKGHKVECRGSRYRYCDFLIKVGTVTMSSSARGISVEVSHAVSGDGCPLCAALTGAVPSGGVLSLRGPGRLLEPHQGVHADFSRRQRPRAAVRVRRQARGSVCPGGLRGHHDPAPGAVQQAAQTTSTWKQRALRTLLLMLFHRWSDGSNEIQAVFRA